MTRSLGMILLVLSLAVGGYLFAQQSKSEGPTSTLARQAESQATAAASATSFAAAAPALQAWYADHGTYAGASLPPAFGVTLARADGTSYCLEAAGMHEVGPGAAAPQPGPC
jgi:inorganic triphosphatase YgiF